MTVRSPSGRRSQANRKRKHHMSVSNRRLSSRIILFALICLSSLGSVSLFAQTAPPKSKPKPAPEPAITQSQHPKLVVLLVVDQMRGDYVDKFRGQWTGGLKRLVDEGAWYRAAAYPYAATETCVGHSTISTGAFPSTHGMIANQWWDRASLK